MLSLDSVRSQGWASRDLGLALAGLGKIVAERTPQPDDEGDALAIELLRWLRYACEIDPYELLQCLGHRKPRFLNEPAWDDLDALFAHHDDSLAKLVAELSRRYSDPARILTQFLDAVAPSGTDYFAVVPEHRRVYDALWAFRTDENVTYLLSRLDLMNWERDDELRELVRQQGERIRRIALVMWPSFSWKQRNDVATLLEHYELHDEEILALLLIADLQSMSPEDRRHYMSGLAVYRDSRVVPRIRAVLDWALDEVATNQTESTKDLVRAAMYELVDRELEPTTSQREHAKKSGIHWHHPMDPARAAARSDN